MAINSRWFSERLTERQLSQRGLAKLMGLDPSAMSLMLRGKRKMTLEEAAQMAVILNVNTNEVLHHAGVKVQTGERTVKIMAHLHGDSTVTMVAKGLHEMTPGPSDLPNDAIAIQAQTAGSTLEPMDGWMMFLSASHGNPANATDTMALCAVKSNGLVIRTMKRGYRRGTYNLYAPGLDPIRNVELAWATPVLWIRTVAI